MSVVVYVSAQNRDSWWLCLCPGHNVFITYWHPITYFIVNSVARLNEECFSQLVIVHLCKYVCTSIVTNQKDQPRALCHWFSIASMTRACSLNLMNRLFSLPFPRDAASGRERLYVQCRCTIIQLILEKQRPICSMIRHSFTHNGSSLPQSGTRVCTS